MGKVDGIEYEDNTPTEDFPEYLTCNHCEKMTVVKSRMNYCDHCGTRYELLGLIPGTDEYAVHWDPLDGSV